MKHRASVSKILLILIGCMVAVPLLAEAGSLSLSIPQGTTGKTVRAKIGFKDATNVTAFNLLLTVSSENVLKVKELKTGAPDFIRNLSFFPKFAVGSQEANKFAGAGSGRVRLVGLAPQAKTGAVSIGTLGLAVVGKPSTGTDPPVTQVITLSGQAYTSGGVVLELEPVSAVFTFLGTTLASPTANEAEGSVDTDGDGIPDAWELEVFGDLSRTGKGDRDRDGYSDLCEYRNGTNPNAPDAPGGSCYNNKTDKRARKRMPAVDLLLQKY
jgi:hypothetical protein